MEAPASWFSARKPRAGAGSPLSPPVGGPNTRRVAASASAGEFARSSRGSRSPARTRPGRWDGDATATGRRGLVTAAAGSARTRAGATAPAHTVRTCHSPGDERPGVVGRTDPPPFRPYSAAEFRRMGVRPCGPEFCKDECMTNTPKWMPRVPQRATPVTAKAVPSGPGQTIVDRTRVASPMPIRSIVKPFRHMPSWSRSREPRASRHTPGASLRGRGPRRAASCGRRAASPRPSRSRAAGPGIGRRAGRGSARALSGGTAWPTA